MKARLRLQPRAIPHHNAGDRSMFKSTRRTTAAALFALLLAAPLAPAWAQAFDASRPHKVVFQVSESDPKTWNLALNNARNVQQALGAEQTAVEIVVYGPGIGMLKMDTPVGERIAEAMGKGVAVVACENTMKGQKLTRADMLPSIGYVPAGVVELMSRQKEGFAYVRP
jgi:intracellular sulfur oxidation DsrE/DsrF family protein